MTYILVDQNDKILKQMNNLGSVVWAERINDPSGEAIQPKLESSRPNVGDYHTLNDGTVVTLHEVIEGRDTTKGDARSTGTKPIAKDGDEWVRVTTYGPALPPPPTPEPGDAGYDYSSLRKREYEKDITFGDQADALLKWTTAIRMKQTALDDAIDGITSISDDDEKAALKTALGPIFDLPADLDTVIGKWLAVKSKFPKK